MWNRRLKRSATALDTGNTRVELVMTSAISSQSKMSSYIRLRSNNDGSPSQAVEVCGSEGLKGEKYYLASALPDGVLQQVEVTARDQ